MTTDLLPCPFCGGVNVKVFGPVGWTREYGISHSCRLFYNGAQEVAQGFLSEKDAIAAWNRRADISPSPEVVKPPFYFDRYINGVRMAEDVCVEREDTLESAMLVAARIASKGPNGEAPVLVYRAPVTQPTPDPSPEVVKELVGALRAASDALCVMLERSPAPESVIDAMSRVTAALAKLEGGE